VIRYSGTWSQERYAEHLAQLQNALTGAGLKWRGEPVWARYDPPWKPWFLRRNVGATRRPIEDERVEVGWRPLDLARDNVEEPRRGENYGETYPYEDTTVLYYWRATYWRRVVG